MSVIFRAIAARLFSLADRLDGHRSIHLTDVTIHGGRVDLSGTRGRVRGVSIF